MSELISIIIPTYNYASYLPTTLDSVLSQKGGVELEVIVVDDGSTDKTPEVLREYAQRVLYIRQQNMGLPAARNSGLVRASGDYVLFLDADDMLGPETLASQLMFLRKHPDYVVAVCRSAFFSMVQNDGRPQDYGCWNLFSEDLGIHLCHFNIAPPHAFLTRKSLIDAVGGFDTTLGACEDHDFWFCCAVMGGRFVSNMDTYVYYRRHSSSMSADLGRQHRYDAIVHQRIAKTLLKGSAPAFTCPSAGLIACAAGCLLTTYRIATLQPGTAVDLFDLAWRCLDIIPNEPTSFVSREYFSARLRLVLELLEQDGRFQVTPLRERAMEILPDSELNGMGAEALERMVAQRHARLC